MSLSCRFRPRIVSETSARKRQASSSWGSGPEKQADFESLSVRSKSLNMFKQFKFICAVSKSPIL